MSNCSAGTQYRTVLTATAPEIPPRLTPRCVDGIGRLSPMRPLMFSALWLPTSRLPHRAAALRACTSSIRHAASQPASDTVVSYVTDVEGNLNFWRRFCAISEVIDDSDGLDGLRLRPGCHLVFGGDSVDKASGDLRFLSSLLSLRRRHPEHVHLVAGNRDINKMRFLAELSAAHWLDADAHPGVYWRVRGGPNGGPATPSTFLAAQPTGAAAEDTVANRLRYMLADNMGSPRAFEFRRAELAALASEAQAAEPLATGKSRAGTETVAPHHVGDEEVLESFLSSVLLPGGLMREYLENARLAVRLGSALFVHGGIHPDALGTVPGRTERLDDVDEWIVALNAFAADEVRAFCDDADSGEAPSWAGAHDRTGFGFFDRPGGRLLAYGMATQPDFTKSPTVVYSSVRAPRRPRTTTYSHRPPLSLSLRIVIES